MLHTKPFQVSALGPALTALVVASVNTFLANYLHPGWARIAPMFIDNWLYWGTGEAFSYAREHFSDTYYFRNPTIIVVGDRATRTDENSLSELVGECGNIQLTELPISSSANMAVYSMVVQ